MESRHPYQIAGAIVAALALSFAAGAVSASPSVKAAYEIKAGARVAELPSPSPEYYPGRFRNQATETEALPPQF